MAATQELPREPVPRRGARRTSYKWIVLSNTTLGVLMAVINGSIVTIALPAIFRGIDLNPLQPGNISYLLWILMGYLLVTAVLVVGLGRLGDIFGRVKVYQAGFVVFTIGSVALALDPLAGGGGALWLILWRLVQGVGGAMLFANSTAIITDAFPVEQRGLALGINQVAALAGTFIGLIAGGLLAEIDWRLVFFVSVPIGIVGTVWSYRSLHEIGVHRTARMDWWGNALFGIGLTVLLIGITYGIQPYGGATMGWLSPMVLGCIIGGAALLVVFCVVETKVAAPMFHMTLFKIRAFWAGNLANFLAGVARGGMQFMLIIWLEGIWLPLHGFTFEATPLWAGIYMVPLTIAFLVTGPLCGALSDRFGARAFASGGLALIAASFVGFVLLPVNFNYWAFTALLVLNGIGSGMYSAPNTTAIMNSVPADSRGAANGMRGTLQNSGFALSIGVFFSLMIVGLAGTLPSTMRTGLLAHHVPAAAATAVADAPPVGSLFAAFLGYNPIQTLAGPALKSIPAADRATLTGKTFFPNLIAGPFHHGLAIAFGLAIAMSLIAAFASMLRGTRFVYADQSVAMADGTTGTGVRDEVPLNGIQPPRAGDTALRERRPRRRRG